VPSLSEILWNNEKKGRFKGTLGGKDITIPYSPDERNNYVSAKFAN
jgi:hypothetical protein